MVTSVSFEDWLDKDWLVRHKTSRSEIGELFGVADRDLKDCQAKGLSADWMLTIAYNAALQAATAALAACGYRAAREAHHYRVIQSLALTIGADPTLIVRFDKFRKKRNLTGYERAGAVSEREAEEMMALARELRDAIERWLRKNHADLIS